MLYSLCFAVFAGLATIPLALVDLPVHIAGAIGWGVIVLAVMWPSARFVVARQAQRQKAPRR